VRQKKPHSSPSRKVGSQILLTITFLPSKGIGELKSIGMITKWGRKSIEKFRPESYHLLPTHLSGILPLFQLYIPSQKENQKWQKNP
jgi:hypothetical protein